MTIDGRRPTFSELASVATIARAHSALLVNVLERISTIAEKGGQEGLDEIKQIAEQTLTEHRRRRQANREIRL